VPIVKRAVKRSVKRARRALRLAPMQVILRRLARRGLDPRTMHALEVFGASGAFHTLDYAERVASLEVWEIDPSYESALHANLPRARVRITDSFEELRGTSGRYDLVVLDNPMGGWGGGHHDHFDILPLVFRVLSERAAIVLTVVPRVGARQTRRAPYLLDSVYLAARGAFYRTDEPRDVPFAVMADRYRALCEELGYEAEDVFAVRRNRICSYVVLQVSRRPAPRST
jgi:hypothetical protein